ncbi:hypothetical protein GGR55DRAFT_302101 [Xylaria sp. FL0064]|nr:hypothetical protein GGR55DRAFT_302101 [Xylaria sp. FL0064]
MSKENVVQIGHRWYTHQCESEWQKCVCDLMPHYQEAAAIAAELGLGQLKQTRFKYSIRYPFLDFYRYKSLLAASSDREILKQLCERTLTPAGSERAWKALRLDEAVLIGVMEGWDSPSSGPQSMEAPEEGVAGGTRVQLLKVADRAEYLEPVTDRCIFISDSGASQNRNAVEKWTFVNKITLGILYSKTETEVIVAVEDTVISTITYDERSLMLLHCVGQVGMALELLTSVSPMTRGVHENKAIELWIHEFDDVTNILASSIGVAAMSNFKAADSRGKMRPSGSSGWLPADMFETVFEQLPVDKGFVDLREYGMESTVRPVSSAHVKLLCPHCWGTDKLSSHSEVTQVQPLRLMGSPNKNGEYTAVSHLWSEYREADSVYSMQRDAAIVGGPASLWIDKLCIRQDDKDEKAAELSRMGSYYAGAHTTLICPARPVAGVPLIEQSRHLITVPSHLKDFPGLNSWRQDPWHGRVWTFQEAYLSKNPRVVDSDTGTGLSACWLDFMAYAAKEKYPTRCEVGLPPYHTRFLVPYGKLDYYTTPFMRCWAACSYHNWAPDISSIQMSLGDLIVHTRRRNCSEGRDRIVGLLGLAVAAGTFRSNHISSLDDAYREAVRCGALGAEVLLTDLGGTSPNSCWIPKSGNEMIPSPDISICGNALRPVVDSDGRLICKASEVEIDMNDDLPHIVDGFEWIKIRMNAGTYKVETRYYMNRKGRAYILAAHDPDSLADRILVWATETGSGTHYIEGTARILLNIPIDDDGQYGTEEKGEIVTLRFS